ncbi:glucosidase 2 subunit beta [Anoplophora glabripennis]|uniref:glucosidase 2 subunit beta n=1 Tax=Anoplophora glabripennis TaxID=217634 RepID=UPI0008751AC0|nr:glucosidase 2 subunit beta [Anoplophora glabripennis]
MELQELNNLKLTNTFLILFVFVCEILTSNVPRPRGVSLSRASLYPPEKDFTCFDGSKTVPFSQVNDDYCDCPDGSDEPGTSACPNGIFHCTNAGHKPLNIASSRVNDGICDCCDGTDEYASGATCRNNCIEQGRSAREEALRRAELVKAGKQLKADYSQKGIQMKQEKQTKLGELQKNKEEAEKVRAEKEALKNEIEEEEKSALEYYRKLEEEEKKRRAEEEEAKNRAEATEIFNKFDSNQDGMLVIAELQTRHNFDKDGNGEVSEEEAKFFLFNQDSVDLENFISICWRDVKTYLMRDAGAFQAPPSENEEEAQTEADDMQESDEHDEEAHEDDEEEEDDQEPEAQEEEHHEEPTTVVYDDETQKIVERAKFARDEHSAADRQVRSIQSEIEAIQNYLNKDFGPEEEFATLQGECFTFEDHEYVYKLCPFDKTSQLPKSTSTETRLGTWGRWAGPEDDLYSVMVYDKGQSCWNGPQRSTQVRIDCGSENKLTSVSEPNRCEYLFTFVTPAACREAPADIRDELHDEL